MMAAKPTLSVTIPTKNSAATLAACLEAVVSQSHSVELVIADDCSTDGTLAIARAFGAQFLPGPLPLLEARYQAFYHSTADKVLLLDSDQILRPGAIDAIIEASRAHEMLILGESSASPDTWLARLYEADKRVLSGLFEHHSDPHGGGLLPRVFRRSVLAKAFDFIPSRVRQVAIAQDHAIIHEAASRVAERAGFVPDAILHVETARLGELWKKYYRWGRGLPELFEISSEYRRLTGAAVKHRLRRGSASPADFASSTALLLLKAVPYSAGYTAGYARLLQTKRQREPLGRSGRGN